MAESFVSTGTGPKLASDAISIDLDGKSHSVHRQHVIAVQPEDGEQIGHDAGQVLAVSLKDTDGTGSAEMNVDGSGTAVKFDYVVAADSSLVVDEIVVWLRDAGATFTAIKFGDLAALTTGITIAVYDDAATPALVATWFATLKDFGDLLALGFEFEPAAQLVADCARFRFKLERAGGRPVIPAGYRIRATVADNLTGLDELRVGIVGRLFS
jgi:hypothetical protein